MLKNRFAIHWDSATEFSAEIECRLRPHSASFNQMRSILQNANTAFPIQIFLARCVCSALSFSALMSSKSMRDLDYSNGIM